MAKSVADELLAVLQAHRENRLQPPPAPVWKPEGVQWTGDEQGDSEESSETS